MGGSRPADLPDFSRPPVVEVVLSVQFEPLEALRSAHVGLLWSQFREGFPKLEEHGQIAHAVETFDEKHPAPKVKLKVADTPSVSRSWFLNEDQTELIQVQPDRFLHNWRKITGEKPYPRYEAIRRSFRSELAEFSSVLSREGIGDLRLNQCEVTYVNHVYAGQGWESQGEVENVLKVWKGLPEESFLPKPEDVSLRVRYLIPGADGDPIGRLHLTLQPAWKKSDGSAMYVLTLTARGAPQGEGLDGAFSFLDTGRRWIVKGFTAITTTDMHEIWGRKDGDSSDRE